MKILICTLIFATIVEVHCRRIIDLDNIRISFDPYWQRKDEPEKGQSEGSSENQSGKLKGPALANENLHRENKNDTVSLIIFHSEQTR